MSRISLALVALLIAVTLLGPALAPYDPAAPVTAPWQASSAGHLLGGDVLGRDVLSRLLTGGRHLLVLSLVAAAAAALVGTLGGLAAGWGGSRVLAAGADLLLAVPVLLPALVLAVSLPGNAAVVVATVVAGAPLTLGVVRDATAGVRERGYVRAARLRGERTLAVLLREVLPAVAGVLAADLGLRFVTALQLASALAVLGLTDAPATGDWAAMLRENLAGAALNPAALAGPALLLALLSLAVAAAAHAGLRHAFGTGDSW
ncbi:ABC transporter permease subunit [Nonomuraea angiospora]|uniref:ABC-type dipeptide/oligopeptide/nickel transport system permease subunit n=1 Tax=Nonomuraea angiospora TaxID=46172 RepID=A0ABR9LU70_9ACTN|nr:ABC transporter permease subunit [Nonomuraea angiospora]MBE1584191.1 ABC-type dipeptide/oligopeptide/nickel transport system permease subunit [Nonomuraea angiospora]